MPKYDVSPTIDPRGLSRKQAAAYVGISATLFDRAVRDKIMPAPFRIFGRVLWDRNALDQAIDRAAGARNAVTEDAALDRELERFERRHQSRPTILDEEWQRQVSALYAMGPTVLAEGHLWSMDAWKEHVSKRPLNKREVTALRAMLPFGDRVVSWRKVSVGLTTGDRFRARLRRFR
jgi:predicted DNA-binding transcriptional regulator AlpA